MFSTLHPPPSPFFGQNARGAERPSFSRYSLRGFLSSCFAFSFGVAINSNPGHPACKAGVITAKQRKLFRYIGSRYTFSKRIERFGDSAQASLKSHAGRSSGLAQSVLCTSSRSLACFFLRGWVTRRVWPLIKSFEIMHVIYNLPNTS